MKTNTFNRIIFILFLVFLGVYFAGKNGYYETKLKEKKDLTEQQIIKFEEDVTNNVALDLNDYLPIEKDDSNFVSRGAYDVSLMLSNLLNEKCKNIWEVIKTLFIS